MSAGGESDVRELVVESVAHGGDGVAREESGRVVFVPRTAPGDRVLAELREERGSWARAVPVEILEPGPGRQKPPCPFYEGCGGCQLQHLERETELRAKRRAVRDALERIGGLAGVEVPAPVTAGPPFGYRNRVTFTLRRDGEEVRAGYHRWDDPERLIDVDDCPLAERPVRDAWKALRAEWGQGAERLPAGRELRLTLRASADGDVALLAAGGGGEPGDPRAVAEAVPGLACYHWRPEGKGRRRLAGAERLPERWQGMELEVGPESFLQVNREVARRMEAYVDDLLEEVRGLRVLDLYAGLGLRALRWALEGARASACELNREAVEDGRRAARERGVSFPFRAGRVEDELRRLLPADLIVVNPPRAGLSEAAARGLKESGAAGAVYVSCDPATLARDVKRLEPAWSVTSVQPFDAFPQTAHVETVVSLRRTEGAAA